MWGVVVGAALLSACGGPQPTGVGPTAPTPSPTAAAPTPVAVPVPTPVASPSRDGAAAALEVVRRYHAAIAARRYDEAYRMWEPGAVGMTAPAFAASFAKYGDYHADVGAPGPIDAGAGQRYVTIPVRASGRLAAGGDFVLEGPFVLHRVADIDGATAEQREWRIRSSALKPRPTATPRSRPGAASDRVAARYRCIDGNRLVVDLDSVADTVTIRRGGRRLGVLAGQRPASGFWYKGAKLELRGQGDAAMFGEPGQPPIACAAIR